MIKTNKLRDSTDEASPNAAEPAKATPPKPTAAAVHATFFH